MITDSLQNSHLYPLGEAWKKAFAFLQTLNESTPDGEYPLDGQALFARVMSYQTKPASQAKFEAHQQYADIQSTLKGAEGIGVINTKELVETRAYDASTDVAFFATPGTVPARVDVYPGSFVFLLPHDGHMPQLEVGTSCIIKKVVVKIALSELTLRQSV